LSAEAAKKLKILADGQRRISTQLPEHVGPNKNGLITVNEV